MPYQPISTSEDVQKSFAQATEEGGSLYDKMLCNLEYLFSFDKSKGCIVIKWITKDGKPAKKAFLQGFLAKFGRFSIGGNVDGGVIGEPTTEDNYPAADVLSAKYLFNLNTSDKTINVFVKDYHKYLYDNFDMLVEALGKYWKFGSERPSSFELFLAKLGSCNTFMEQPAKPTEYAVDEHGEPVVLMKLKAKIAKPEGVEDPKFELPLAQKVAAMIKDASARAGRPQCMRHFWQKDARGKELPADLAQKVAKANPPLQVVTYVHLPTRVGFQDHVPIVTPRFSPDGVMFLHTMRQVREQVSTRQEPEMGLLLPPSPDPADDEAFITPPPSKRARAGDATPPASPTSSPSGDLAF